MSKINCPYCGSVQVKAMANQPKKYPRPSDPVELKNWQRGFDCKKCGNDFVVTPPKPMGFFTKLAGWIILALIALFIYAVATDSNEEKKPTKEETQTIQKTDKIPEEAPSQQEFSKEAEEAAHAYIPQLDENQPESIRGSNNQSDTLNIKTTIRESN